VCVPCAALFVQDDERTADPVKHFLAGLFIALAIGVALGIVARTLLV
jgi:hypothetical protein